MMNMIMNNAPRSVGQQPSSYPALQRMTAPLLMLLPVLFFAAGCQWLPPAPQPQLLGEECQRFSRRLGSAIDSHTYFDPALPPKHHHQPFYLYHRKDRFLAAFNPGELSAPEQAAWYAEMRRLGSDILKTEAARLPDAARQQLGVDQSGIDQMIETCSAEYAALATATFPAMDYPVPDSYSTAQRVFGIYPLLSRLARGSIEEYRQMMTDKVQQGPQRIFARYSVYRLANNEQAQQKSVTFQEIKTWFDLATGTHPLRFPALTGLQLQQLSALYAPTTMVEHSSDADLLGRMIFSDVDNKAVPRVETGRPVMYWYPSYTHYQGKILLQLNYGFWFPERPPQDGFDIYAGPLDGLLWRVTLDTMGRPLVYDSIHQCGCYHKVYLPAGVTADLSQLENEKPLVFATGVQPAQPRGLVLKIEAATHYIVDVAATLEEVTPGQGQAAAYQYQLQPYDTLLTLAANGTRQSLFGESGIVDHSARPERFLLWPLGVPSAGAMRQRGLHAIAFIGLRHFDEPFLWQQLQITRQE